MLQFFYLLNTIQHINQWDLEGVLIVFFILTEPAVSSLYVKLS